MSLGLYRRRGVGVVTNIRAAVKTIIYVRSCNYGMGKGYVLMAIAGRPVARGKTRVNVKAEARFFG
jgi:hypothetical protein